MELLHANSIDTGISTPEPFFEPAEWTRPEDESADDEGRYPNQTRQNHAEDSDRNEHHAELRGKVLHSPNLRLVSVVVEFVTRAACLRANFVRAGRSGWRRRLPARLRSWARFQRSLSIA